MIADLPIEKHDIFMDVVTGRQLIRMAVQHNRTVDDEIRLAIETHIVKFKAEQEGK